jgi:hypothetical protein
MVRDWPRVHAYRNSDSVSYTEWIQGQLGRNLHAFFHAWLLGKAMPRFH